MRLQPNRLTIVAGAALDIVGLGVLFLQQTGESRGDFPADMPSLKSRLNHKLVDDDWFPWLVAASVFPVLGATGAICLWRPLLCLYCAFLVSCIGEHALLVVSCALLTPKRSLPRWTQACERTWRFWPVSRRGSSRAHLCCETCACSRPVCSFKSSSFGRRYAQRS